MKAPLALFVYNRVDHTQRTVEALAKNHLASESDLTIFSDAAKKSSDVDSVQAVRAYIKTIAGFKSLTIVERPSNFGLSKSIIDGVTDVINKFQKIIVLEDDLVTSPFFLQYMNDSLDRFERDDRVISIHGYMYPVKQKLPELFFLRGADCWGWATWKRGWDLLERDGKSLLGQIIGRQETKRFTFNDSYPYIQMLEDQIAGRNNSWAILWYGSAFVKNKLTLYPGHSLVHNIGNDSSGTHSIATDSYNVQITGRQIDVGGSTPVFDDNADAVNAIADYFTRIHSKYGYLKVIFNKYFRRS
jgi:hypothetical protein